MSVKPRSKKLHSMTVTALMAAVLCALSPVAIPIGPVPITLCTLLLYLTAHLLPTRQAASTALVYVLLGMAGMPVFQGFTGGLGCVLGPTGGYIVGYIPMTVLCAAAVHRFGKNRLLQAIGMAAGTALLYTLGTTWYCVQAGQGLGPALAMCVLPFLPGDLIKILVVLSIGPMLRRNLEKAGLLNT